MNKTLDDRLIEKVINWTQHSEEHDKNTYTQSLREMLTATLDIADNMNISATQIKDYVTLATKFAIKQASYNDPR